jgi:spore maturation protein CgeB
MRSLEIAAIGGCMLAEDTTEHRELFGAEGEAVLYFGAPAEAATKARSLIDNPAERQRLAAALHARIVGGGHTYRDRLGAMTATATQGAGRVAA